MSGLEKVFNIQKKFSEKLFQKKYELDLNNLSNEEKLKWSKEYILCAIKELTEMLDELDWKTHREVEKEINMDNFLEEGVDTFKFLINLMLINGFDDKDFLSKFIEKSEKVNNRFENESHNN